MEKLLVLSVLISFLVTLVFMRRWIKKAEQIGLVWEDMNKLDQSKKIAGSGGLIVLLGFLVGVLSYIAIKTFYFKSTMHIIEIYALLATILIVSFVGFIDDIFGWHHGGLSAKSRLILVFFAAIPLMAINAGESIVSLPIVGLTNLGILYPLVLIPIGIMGASTTFNFLAGYNGLEAGQGILILSALAYASWVVDQTWLSLIAICMIASLIGFLFYNKFPARVFPGDILTYSIGALIAVMAILGNYEQFAVFIFIPYILETGLKLRGKLKRESFGEPQEDGSIKNKYDKIYGLEHLAIKVLEKIKKEEKVHETDVVLAIHVFQIAVIILGVIIFF